MVQHRSDGDEKSMAMLIKVMGDPTAFTLLIYRLLAMQKDLERRIDELEKRVQRLEDQ